MTAPEIYPKRPHLVSIMAMAGSTLLLITAVIAVIAWKNQVSWAAETLVALTAVWVVAPPIWFWYEFLYVYRKVGNTQGFEHFKYSQQLSIGIWAGIALLLFALVSSKRLEAVLSPTTTSGAIESSVTDSMQR